MNLGSSLGKNRIIGDGADVLVVVCDLKRVIACCPEANGKHKQTECKYGYRQIEDTSGGCKLLKGGCWQAKLADTFKELLKSKCLPGYVLELFADMGGISGNFGRDAA